MGLERLEMLYLTYCETTVVPAYKLVVIVMRNDQSVMHIKPALYAHCEAIHITLLSGISIVLFDIITTFRASGHSLQIVADVLSPAYSTVVWWSFP